MVILLAAVCAMAAVYQMLALLAVFTHWRRPKPQPSNPLPPVSILKPVHGADPGFADALRSHARIAYPQFEILVGVRDPDDPVLPVVRALQQEFPTVQIRLVSAPTAAPNAKVGTLQDLAAAATCPICVVNDADISVPPEYLEQLIADLQDPSVGLVTCLYRASAGTFPGIWEALGIATEFVPNALIAPFAGVREFGLGSTLAFRASDLDRAGGFGALRDYIADDYQLGRNLTRLGLRVRMSRMVVSTHLADATWSAVWAHQVRWARTIRVSRSGYLGLPLTNASLWAALALIAGWWSLAAGLVVLRLMVGLAAGILILRDPVTARWWWLMPLRDLWGLCVWFAGVLPAPVTWRGRQLRLDSNGRIVPGGADVDRHTRLLL